MRPTRSSSSGVNKFVEPKCQTATYQKSYIIRCICVWNVVTDELNLHINALNDFKRAMVEYYITTLSNYDCENPRTFKTVCLKCNKCRCLAQPVSCCFYLFLYIFLIIWAHSNWLTFLWNPCHFFFVILLITLMYYVGKANKIK